MKTLSVTYASSPSSDLLIPTLEFNNETAGVIRLAQSFNDVTATTSYICYLGSDTAQVTRGGGSLTLCGLTNGTQIASSPLYYA